MTTSQSSQPEDTAAQHPETASSCDVQPPGETMSGETIAPAAEQTSATQGAAARTAAPAMAVAAPSAPPRIRIGSQRSSLKPPGPPLNQPTAAKVVAPPTPPQPKPVTPAAPRIVEEPAEGATSPLVKPPPPKPRATEKVPLPNVRASLSPDLEEELAAALGDASLDDMLSQQTTGSEDAELAPETRLTGRVLSVHRDQAFFDLGGRRQGILSLINVEKMPDVGSTMDVTVARFNADEGLYELGLVGAARRCRGLVAGDRGHGR